MNESGNSDPTISILKTIETTLDDTTNSSTTTTTAETTAESSTIADDKSTTGKGHSRSSSTSSSLSVEEAEPKLKYERMFNDLKKILQNDAISCIAFHSKLICVGSRWGRVHVLDHQGNEVLKGATRSHSVAVNQISMDERGDFMATCSDDGKAYVYGLYVEEHSMEISLGRSVKSIAIDPAYYKLGRHRRFVTGDDRLVLHERSFLGLGSLTSTVLFEARAPIQNIKWRNRFIAWASDAGIRIYDIVTRTPLVLIKWNRFSGSSSSNNNGAAGGTAPAGVENSHSTDRFPCSLMWKSDTVLIIGWMDAVRICVVRKRKSVLQNKIKDIPEFDVIVDDSFITDYFIAGVCPLDKDQLVVLAYAKQMDQVGKALRPQMHVLQKEQTLDDEMTLHSSSFSSSESINPPHRYVEVYTDNLSLRGFADCACDDYHLDCLIEENCFIITGPKDVVIATMLDSDDRIDWMVRHNNFEDAMSLIKSKEHFLCRNTQQSVGMKYIEYLRKSGDYEKAGQLCPHILGSDKHQWQNVVLKFATDGHLRAISHYLPTNESDRLEPWIYEIILYEYLKKEQHTFVKLINEWPPHLYNVEAITNALYDHLNRPDNVYQQELLHVLALLYTYGSEHEKALRMYISLRSRQAFKLIRDHKLYGCLTRRDIQYLMDLDAVECISLFMDKDCKLETKLITAAIKHNDYYMFLYLDGLDQKDYKWGGIPSEFHARLVKLYAKFAPHKLLPLLRRSNDYPIHEVLRICREKNLHTETVYLLGRIGNTKEALRLLMHGMNDIEQAIAFCKEHDDMELWEELIECSLDNSERVTYLMQKIGAYVDPSLLVRRIADGKQIVGLKKSLVKMLSDYNIQVSVKKGCTNIIVSDSFNVLTKLVTMQQRAMTIDDDLICFVCRQKIISQKQPPNPVKISSTLADGKTEPNTVPSTIPATATVNNASSIDQNVVMFFCKHSFHENCLPSVNSKRQCIICCSNRSNRTNRGTISA